MVSTPKCLENPEKDRATPFYGDELVNDRTYFACRYPAFWASVVLMVGAGFIMGSWQAFYTETYIDYMLFGAKSEDTKLVNATRLRGLIALTLTSLWIVAFLRRMALARYVVYFGTSFMALNFAKDLGQLAIADDKTMMITSSVYLIIRPVMLIALLTSAFSFADSVRFERSRVKPGQRLRLSDLA